MSYTIDGVFTSDVVNGKALGLYGDGVHDDSDRLNSILSGYDCVYLPAGTYLISKTITVPDNTTLFGDGWNTIIQLASTYTLTGVTWRQSYKYPYLILNDNTILKNIMVNGDETEAADQGQVGVMAHGDNIIIDNIKTNNVNYFPEDWIGGASGYGTVNAPGYGIQVFEASNVTIVDCVTNGNGYEGIGTEASDFTTIARCIIGDGNRTGIQIHRGSKHTVISDCIIDNHCENKTTDITIHGENSNDDYIDDLKIIGCSLIEPANGDWGIQTVTGYEKNVVIASCRITANTVAIFTSNAMAETVQNSKDYVIQGNIIESGGDGIEIRGDRCVVCNNIIHYYDNDILITGDNKIVANNLILQEQSAE